MADSNQPILSAKRILCGVCLPQEPHKTYLPGMEDELEAVITAAQLKRLLDTDSVSGDWTPKGAPLVPMARSRKGIAALQAEENARAIAAMEGTAQKLTNEVPPADTATLAEHTDSVSRAIVNEGDLQDSVSSTANPFLTLRRVLKDLFWLAAVARQGNRCIEQINEATAPWSKAEAAARKHSAGWGIPFWREIIGEKKDMHD